MSDIVKGISNLFAAIFDIIRGIFTTAFQAVESVISLFIGLFRNVFNVAEGVAGFVIGNIFVIGTIAAVYFGYILFQQRQGNKSVAANPLKKTS